MPQLMQIRPEFVTFVPKDLQPGIAYVSMEYATVIHACCCGCGNKVVTPLAPGRWQLFFDGESISLTPSIGNWSFSCQSHYWIHQNRVVWDGSFTKAQIAAVRAADRRALLHHQAQPGQSNHTKAASVQESWWRKLLRWLTK